MVTFTVDAELELAYTREALHQARLAEEIAERERRWSRRHAAAYQKAQVRRRDLEQTLAALAAR